MEIRMAERAFRAAPTTGEGQAQSGGTFNRLEEAMTVQATTNQVRWVPIEEIVAEEALMDDCPEGDVLLSLRSDGRYLLLSGSEKVERYRLAGFSCVDAVICPSDRLEERISKLLDKQARGRLHFLEEAEAYRSLMAGDGLTAEELSRRTGRSAATIRRKVRLLGLSEETVQMIRENRISERTAEVLLRIPGQQGRQRVLKQVIEAGLDFKATEALVDQVLSRMPVPLSGGRRLKPMMRDYRLYLNAIRGIVEQMQDAGVEADLQVSMGRRVADVRITMPLFMERRGQA